MTARYCSPEHARCARETRALRQADAHADGATDPRCRGRDAARSRWRSGIAHERACRALALREGRCAWCGSLLPAIVPAERVVLCERCYEGEAVVTCDDFGPACEGCRDALDTDFGPENSLPWRPILRAEVLA